MLWGLSLAGAPPADEDAALLARVARGEQRALKVLYDRWGSRALAVAHRVLASTSEAEEVVQEAFVEVWKRAAQYDVERGVVRAWIMTIVRSRAIDRLRARGAVDRTVQGLEREAPPPPAPSPLEDAEARAERERVAAALAALPEAQRQVIELAYYEGITQREIAERTGEPLGTVKTRVRLALEKLGAILGGAS
jgi:RNA polymerase sigma-70 factor (ECF subfamily)